MRCFLRLVQVVCVLAVLAIPLIVGTPWLWAQTGNCPYTIPFETACQEPVRICTCSDVNHCGQSPCNEEGVPQMNLFKCVEDRPKSFTECYKGNVTKEKESAVCQKVYGCKKSMDGTKCVRDEEGPYSILKSAIMISSDCTP